MAYYSTVWFWLIIIGVILLIAGIIWYFAAGNDVSSTTKTFIYALIAFGALLLLIGIIFAIFDSGEPTPAAVVVEKVPAATVTKTTETVTAPVTPPQVPVQTTTTYTSPVGVTVLPSTPMYNPAVPNMPNPYAPMQYYMAPYMAPQVASIPSISPQYITTPPQMITAQPQQYIVAVPSPQITTPSPQLIATPQILTPRV